MDISNLSEKELRDLNHQVVLRLKFLQDAHVHALVEVVRSINGVAVFTINFDRIFKT